jgi:superfamily II DNA/RNA helicase
MSCPSAQSVCRTVGRRQRARAGSARLATYPLLYRHGRGRASSSFAALGLDGRVCSALLAHGIGAPTEIQVKAAGPILKRKNALVAAETGSGKTLAYLAPLLHNLLRHEKDTVTAAAKGRGATRLLVLTPNQSLCAQVQMVTAQLIGHGGLALTCGTRGDRLGDPNILVSTPRALLPPGVTPDFSRVETIVLDEGDLLLRDGYVKDISHLLMKIKREAR